MNPEDIARLDPKQRLCVLGRIYGQEAVARARLDLQRVELAALAIELGTQLLDIRRGAFHWTGGAVDLVMATRAGTREKSTPWPISIETGLLGRIRTSKFDLDEFLAQHVQHCAARQGLVAASVGTLASGENFAVMTVADPFAGIEGTYLFSLQRESSGAALQ